MRGQSGMIAAVVNALSKAGVELGEHGSKAEGKQRRADAGVEFTNGKRPGGWLD